MTNEIAPINEEFISPVNQQFQAWEDRLNRLAADMPTIAGSNEFPEWWYQKSTVFHDLAKELKSEEPSPDTANQFLEFKTVESSLTSQVTGREPMLTPFHSTALFLGEAYLGKAIQQEGSEGPLHTALLDSLRNTLREPSESLSSEIGVLKSIYDVKTSTELLGISDDTYSRQVRSLLLCDSGLKSIKYEDGPNEYGENWEEIQESTRQWMGKAVAAAVHIPEDEAVNYVYSASRRGDIESTLAVIDRFDQLGTENIRAISQATGIHGLEGYSVEQLKLMQQFAANPEELSAGLANHDVTAVLINRFGDHNGIFERTASDIDDDNGRTLFFEITKMDDIYKSMVRMGKHGIKPATLVLAAHSAPGQFMVSDSREANAKRRDIATIAGKNLVRLLIENDELKTGDNPFAMQGMKGMARLVENYMQSSKGVDDDPADIGKKKIIFKACDAGTEAPAMDIDDNGNKIEVQSTSVIKQLGQDLASSDVKSNVDIYGADDGIQIKRTAKGIIYTAQPKQMGMDRVAMQSTRVRLEAGKISVDKIDEVILRK